MPGRRVSLRILTAVGLIGLGVSCSSGSEVVNPQTPEKPLTIFGKYALNTVTGANSNGPLGLAPNGYYKYPSGTFELRADSSYTETLAVEWLSASGVIAGTDTLRMTGRYSMRGDSVDFKTSDGNYLFTASLINGWLDYVDEGIRVNYHK
jgi:hypothetical protein